MDAKGKGIVIDPEEPQLDLSLNLGLGGMPPSSSSSLSFVESSLAAEVRARPIFANSVYSVGSSSRTVVTDQAAVVNVSGVGSSASSEVNSYLEVAQQQQQQQGPLLYETAPQVAGYEFPAPPELSNYCLINITSRRGRSGGSRKRNPARRPPPREDEARICTNYNCQVKTSPMWRKGPLGPKTLCNRCGIRFRKMQMKAQKERKAAEAAMKATCELLKASRI